MDHVTITIPATLYKKLELVAKDSGFKSVEECIYYVLGETVSMYELEKTVEPFNEEDIKSLKKRFC